MLPICMTRGASGKKLYSLAFRGALCVHIVHITHYPHYVCTLYVPIYTTNILQLMECLYNTYDSTANFSSMGPTALIMYIKKMVMQ